MRQHSKSGSLLDIGTGIVPFLSHAQGYSLKLGTEVSSIAVQIAAERYGMRVLEGDVESLWITQRFDNITCFHVLEQVQRPAVLLARCRELLAPNGRLFIAVPNDLGTPRTRLGLRRLQPITLSGEEIHLSHFTPKSLSAVLNRAGLSVAYLSMDPHWDTPKRREFLRYYAMAFFTASPE
jgi:2-polyprenyl-3-methyl-5-hydroxy-6-metoxy-1,4-benzoquinol methylase